MKPRLLALSVLLGAATVAQAQSRVPVATAQDLDANNLALDVDERPAGIARIDRRVNSFIMSQSGGSDGLGFAIPSATVRTVFRQFKAYGTLRRQEIGIGMQTITPMMAVALGLARLGRGDFGCSPRRPSREGRCPGRRPACVHGRSARR